jgi:filamentous hemagglutinin family protein
MRPNRPALLAAALAVPSLAAQDLAAQDLAAQDLAARGLAAHGRTPAADAGPVGGAVVAGQASITRTPGRTQVQQGSDRAILEWQRFDVGANHQVDIRQPGAASWSLNRVTGADPSAIAGRVTSNGGVALVNPAGVLFHRGAQVDVAALIATTSDITNQNFQAGRMVFDGAPRPGARIENRGSITVADQGLAALVGPQVASSGSIRARLGRVALAGGEAFALDLAGDGLLALDVTRQVAAAPGGATALVTQSGSIAAEGGSVLLTARAASGVLESLVQSGGTTDAAQVALRAEGGGLRLDGMLRAPLVEATASGTVRLGPGAVIESPAGHVTLGAGQESRIGQPRRLSARTVVERGAAVRAEGGTVIVHAERHATMSGSLAAERIEVSSRGGLALDGTMQGQQVLVDPVTLRIVGSLSGAAEPAEITAASIAATTGALTLQAERAIRVEAPVAKPNGRLTLETTAPDATGIQIRRGMTIAGDLVLRSAGDIAQSAGGAALNLGTLEARSGGGSVRLDAANNSIRALAGGSAAGRFDVTSRLAMSVDGAISAADIALATPQTLALFAPVSAAGTLDLFALRGVGQQAGGAGISAHTLRLDAALGAVSLQGAGNHIARLGDSFTPRGLSLVTQGALELVGGINAGLVSLEVRGGDLTQAATSRLIAGTLQVAVPDGGVRLDAPLNGIAEIYGFAGDPLLVATQGPLRLAAPLSAPEIDLRATGDVTQDQGARLTALSLRLDTDGSAILAGPQNAVAALDAIRTGGDFSLSTTGALDVPGTVAAPGVTLRAGGALTAGGAILAERVALHGASVGLGGAGHGFGVLGAGGATGDFSLATAAPLRLDGALAVGGTLRLEAASLSLEAPIAATSGMLRATMGDLVQTGAAPITAASLVAEAPAGAVRLDAALNMVDRLGGVALGGFAWRGGGDLALDPLAGLSAAQLSLAQDGRLVQQADGAPLRAETLSIQAGGRIDLRAAGNRVPELGAVATPGGLYLATTGALLLTAPVTAAEAELAAELGIAQQPGAPLQVGLLRARADSGPVVLEQAGNALPRLGASRAGGEFRLATGGALAIEGPVAAGGTLALQAAQDVTQAAAGAGLAAPLLRVRSLAGNVALDGAGNFIEALGASGAAGDFALAQQGPASLSLAGPVSAPTLRFRTESGLDDSAGGGLRGAILRLDTAGPVRLDAAGQHLFGAIGGRAGALSLALDGGLLVTEALDAPGMMAISAATLGILAPVSAGTARLAATAGDISQTLSGAGLSATLLNAQAASGSVLLDGQGNRVAALGAGGAAVAFALAQEGAAALRLTGPVAAPTIFLRAAAAGVENMAGGSLAAGLLRLDTPGAVRIDAAQAVERLGGRAGSLRLATTGALRLEPLEATGALVLSATALHLAGPVAAGSANLVARSGDITQAGEAGLTVEAAGLRLEAGGMVMLEGAGNAVARLAGASAEGPMALATTGDLALAGPLSGRELTLRAGGAMRLDGAVFRADRAVLLVAPGGFTAGATSRLLPRDAALLPVLILDSRQGAPSGIPPGLLADRPGLAPAQQPTQLADFGPARALPGGPAVLDLDAGAAPVFLLLDGAPALGVLEAGRLGLVGQGGSAFILGALGGEGGAGAARAVAVAAPRTSYLFNNCVMSAATCSGAAPAPPSEPIDPVEPIQPVLAPEVPPAGSPAVPDVLPVLVRPEPAPILPAAATAQWPDRRDPHPGAFLPRRPKDEAESYCPPNSPSANPRSSPAPSDSPSIRSGLPAALPSGPPGAPASTPRSCMSSGAEILPSPS